MKIGIVTFHSAHNYGAVLQAWALQEYLNQQGHEVQIVNLRLPVIDKLYRLTYRTKRKVTGVKKVDGWINGLYYEVRCLKHRIQEPVRYKKYKKFEAFISHRLPLTERFDSYKALKQAQLQYDVLIAGSDQIWNSTMMKGISPAYFLQFANEDAIRVSYAASIGTEKIAPEYRILFKRYLREFDSISVREKKAKEEVEKLTDQNVDLVADPTFLLQREDFDRLKKKPKVSGKYIYVHNVHLKRVDEALNSVAEEMSARLGLPVIHNWDQKIYKNEAGHFTGGVEEFLGMVSGAEAVITNSFHCTVFSIIYEKNFITVPHYKHPDRMRNLLEELGISDHLIDSGEKIPKGFENQQINYQKVSAKKAAMGEAAGEFLRKAVQSRKQKDDRTYFEYQDIFRCYGCRTCVDVCPVQAISMVEDKEGFSYPVINKETCIQCGKCKKACIYHKKAYKNRTESPFPLVYAAYSKDREVVEASTSGGMFTPLYRKILEKGGQVVGVRYDDNMEAVYDIAGSEEACEKFRGSKYVYADSRDVKPRVKELLENDQYVLYSGTPCQIAGLKSYLGKTYDRLYTVELICHGVNSAKIFRLYRAHLENLYQSGIVKFEFRNKFKGVDQPFIVCEFESGSLMVESAAKNNFNRAFLNNYIERPSCYTCEYAGEKTGAADLTIGDYWGIEKQHPEFTNQQGVSVLKINTPKGKELFEECREEYVIQESTYQKAYEKNHVKPMVMQGQRGRIFWHLDRIPIDELLLTFNQHKRGGIKGL